MYVHMLCIDQANEQAHLVSAEKRTLCASGQLTPLALDIYIYMWV